VRFAAEDGSSPSRIGWVGADDGLLALDRNGDGAITNANEVSFIGDLSGALSDLEGLTAFDTNEDGYFDVADERFAEFQVWNDANQDGVSQAAELKSLADHGIVAINLTRDPTAETTRDAWDNVVTATSDFVREDGSLGLVGDVALAVEALPPLPVDGEPTDIGSVDRSAHSDRRPSWIGANAEQPSLNTGGVDVPQEPTPYHSPTSKQSGDETPQSLRRSPRSLQDWLRDIEGTDDIDESLAESVGQRAPSALHVSLDSVAKRRLQMIEAMASFDAEGAVHLSLHPSRRIDARTLELLTAVEMRQQ
jgi:hypothetical protein